ncbi:9991_t:CDS:2, partial [Dentiscutata erythropus]
MAEQLQHELQKLNLTSIMIITPKEIIYQGKTQDLQKPITSAGLQDMIEVFGYSWEDKVRSICKKIKRFENEDKAIYRTLEWCYRLEVGSRKEPEVFRVAKRTFELYNARGIWNLYQAKKISYRVLAHMYNSDFEVVKQEAYRVYLEEAGDFTIPD